MTAIPGETIFLCLAGSQAHGTAREGSDVDVRGVCVAPLTTRLSLFDTFEQFEGLLPDELAAKVMPQLDGHPTAARALQIKAECVIFDVAKFIRLCAAANPNALEILFADERDWLVARDPWRQLHAERHLFLTRSVQQTFNGYAMAQLKKIKTHRAWLLNPPRSKPTREDFGLPAAKGTLSRDDQNRLEQAIADKVRSYGIETLEMPRPTRVALNERLQRFSEDTLGCTEAELDARLRAVATSALQIPANVVAILNSEKQYRAALKHWESYRSWQSNRNPARAALERQHGYDTKHAMHLIRLMRMGTEVLREGELRVRRPDAAELQKVRDGKLTYDELLAEAERLQREMLAASETCQLPDAIDQRRVDELAFRGMVETRELSLRACADSAKNNEKT